MKCFCLGLRPFLIAFIVLCEEEYCEVFTIWTGVWLEARKRYIDSMYLCVDENSP